MVKPQTRLRHQRIRTNLTGRNPGLRGLRLHGYLRGKRTWLGITCDQTDIAWIDGQSLYRLAKAIVRHFEEGED